jgi:hypothetical protein
MKTFKRLFSFENTRKSHGTSGECSDTVIYFLPKIRFTESAVWRETRCHDAEFISLAIDMVFLFFDEFVGVNVRKLEVSRPVGPLFWRNKVVIRDSFDISKQINIAFTNTGAFFFSFETLNIYIKYFGTLYRNRIGRPHSQSLCHTPRPHKSGFSKSLHEMTEQMSILMFLSN